jgi:hypothetical protein
LDLLIPLVTDEPRPCPKFPARLVFWSNPTVVLVDHSVLEP